jgi:phosphoribosylglycinamide formyltransferase-1
MKVGVFAYNFEHKKTQDGLLNLFINDYNITCILAANWQELNIPQSKIRIVPKDLHYTHPKKIAERLDIPYHVVEHNSNKCEKLIKNYDLDVGIILGARILKRNIISAFNIGIINLHPGLIPQNRGLDNIKWAILKKFEQAVTSHFITNEIDFGPIIVERKIRIYMDDTLMDLHLRIQNLEQILMIKSLKILEGGKKDFEMPKKKGNYFSAVPPKEEKRLFEAFEDYKKIMSGSDKQEKLQPILSEFVKDNEIVTAEIVSTKNTWEET